MVLRWELYDTVFRAAEALETASRPSNRRRDVDRRGATVWYAKKKGEALVVNPEDANGRQEQRSGRDVAKHDRRDGERIQFLRQSGDGVAGIQQGRQSGRRGHSGRAKAARRSHGEISRQHESAEPGTDGQHGRAAAVDRRTAERDQGATASGS